MKYKVNISNITHVYEVEDSHVVSFIGGKVLTLPKNGSNKIDDIFADLYEFTPTMRVNLNNVDYIKNNFESTDKSVLKITLTMVTGPDLYKAFSISQEREATREFETLSKLLS